MTEVQPQGQTEPQNFSYYQHYKGIMHLIDFCRYDKLSGDPDLLVEINIPQQGRSPLYLAVLRKDAPIVHLLLQCGADPNFVCKNTTPLYMATLFGETDIVKYLLEFGADPNILCTAKKISPLHLFSAKGMLETGKMLLDKKANVNIHSPKFGTPLHVAVSKNHSNCVQLLLAAGADVNERNEDGETVLHIAAKKGFHEIVKLLLKQPNMNALIKEKLEGNTALHLACHANQEVIALMLVNKFPDLAYVRNDYERQTPLFYGSDPVRKAVKASFTNRVPGFPFIFNNHHFSDMRIYACEKPIHAHRVIILSRCPKFFSFLKHSNEKDYHLLLQGFEPQILTCFLYYLYTDNLKCDKALLSSLGQFAEKVGEIRLKKLCMEANQGFNVFVPESSFSYDMRKALTMHDISDVIFLVEEAKIPAHRAILCQQEYFRAMFLGNANLKESNMKEIPIKDVPLKAFELIVQYAYTYEVRDIPAEIAIEVFQMSSRFMMDSLRHACETFLGEHMTKENVCGLFQLADMHKSLFLREECFDFIVAHWRTMEKSEDFQHLPKELRDEIFQFVDVKAKRKFNQTQAVTETLFSKSAEDK